MPIVTQLFFIILNAIANRISVFRLIGAVNKRWHFLRAVFVTYPASEEIALVYAPLDRHAGLKWRPYLVGFYRQNGWWGIKLVISSYPEEIAKASYDCLSEFYRLAERLQQITGAECCLFGAALTSALRSKRLIKTDDDANLAAKGCILAATQLAERLGLSEEKVVFVFLATYAMQRRLTTQAIQLGLDYARLKFVNPDSREPLPDLSAGKTVILVSLVKEDQLRQYLSQITISYYVINEAYIAGLASLARELREKCCDLYQLCGIEGQTYPPSPGIYRGSIPFCQGWDDKGLRVVIKKVV